MDLATKLSYICAKFAAMKVGDSTNKQPDRVMRHKCPIENCAYATDYPANLKRHMKSHGTDAVEGPSTN